MNKLPLKYQGVTQGEWRQCNGGSCSCKFIWSGEGATVATGRPMACIHGEWGDGKDMVYGEVPEEQVNANATLMADSKRLAGAVVELRNALEGYAHCGDGCTCGDGWSHEGAKIALELTKEWAA